MEKLWIFIPAFLLGIFVGCLSYSFFHVCEMPDPVIIEHVDTVKVKQNDSIPSLIKEIKPEKAKTDTFLIRDTVYLRNILDDFFTQKVFETSFKKDKLYDLKISSYISENNLDSTTITGDIYNTTRDIIMPAKDKNKIKFNHGPMAGAGWGLINKEFDVFVGYGFQITF